MVKVIKSVSIDEDIVQRIEASGVVFSHLVNDWAGQYVSSQHGDYEFEMVIKVMDKELAFIHEKLEFARQEAVYLDERFKRLTKRREDMIVEHDDMKRSGTITRMVKQLNSSIINAGYDPVLIKYRSKELIEDIQKFNPYFDIDKHIDRVRRIVEDR